MRVFSRRCEDARPSRRASRARLLPAGAVLVSVLVVPVLVTGAAAPAGAAGGRTALAAAPVAGEAMPADPALLLRLGRDRTAALYAKAVDLQEVAQLRLPAAEKAAARVAGHGTALVILWEFTDHPADQVAHPNSAYDQLLFSTGTLSTGSMNDFYLENSYGAYGVQGGVSGWTTANKTYASYAKPGGVQDFSTCRNMIIDAIAQLDPVLDFSQYDNDGPDGIPHSGDDDGYVDALFFIHAGPGQEQTGNTSDIWSHASGFTGGLATNDGVRIYRYSVEPEELISGALMTVGVFCHEYGHVLGLPDLYDVDYSSNGIGEWGLMSGGSWNQGPGEQPGARPAQLTAWCKKELGWLTPTTLTGSLAGVSIPPVETSPVAYRIWRHGATGGSEYFLVENRRRLGFDLGLVRRQVIYGLPAPEGLVIYHVDESITSNAGDRHRLVDVVEATPWQAADGTWHESLDGELGNGTVLRLSNNNRGDNGDLWPGFATFNADSTDWSAPRGRDRFADDTIPSAKDYSCDPTGIAISGIALAGQNVTADFTIAPAAKSLPLALGAATFDFEDGTDGWQFCRSYVHWDTSQSAGCTGAGGLWFGVDDPSWPCPGYGNGWDDITWKTLSVAPGATVTIRHKFELEPDYDYAYLEARCAEDPDAAWFQIASFNGTSGCRTDTYNIPSGIFAQCPSQGGDTAIDLRLRLSSDEGWSSEDGIFCGLGWWVDQVTVQNAVTGVGDTPGAGLAVTLLEPSPNPFNPSTRLRFHVPAAARSLTLTIHDQRGRLVRALVSEEAPAEGWLEATWDGRDGAGRRLPSGVYFARLNVDGVTSIKKMALVK